MIHVFFLPGPGQYKADVKKNLGNPMITKDRRFQVTIKEDVPGPGAYEVGKAAISRTAIV